MGKVLLLCAILSVTALLGTPIAHGFSFLPQEVAGWPPPQHIPGYGDEIWTPYLVAGQNQTVYAFASDWVDEEHSVLAIWCSQWTEEQGWTEPVDILLAPRGQARVKGAYLDPEGFIHIVFFGGDDSRANVYHTKAHATIANRATAWMKPVIVGEGAVTPDEASFIGDGKSLYVVYSGNLEMLGNSLYAVSSEDGGETWSEPLPIFSTYAFDRWPLAVYSTMDKEGRPHIVWSVVDSTGNSEAIYYTSLDIERGEWRDPIQLAERGLDYETDTPSIIEYNDELILIYHNDKPTTRWMQRSSDGGRSWTEPLRLFAHIGSNGPASLVIDSSNTLHMFFGNRVGEHPAVHGMWHSIWSGSAWRPPVAVVSGPVTDEFDPSFARAVVSQGNTVLLTWISDPGIANRGAWFSSTQLNSPELPLIPLPSPVATPTVPPTPTPTPDTTPTPTVAPSPLQLQPSAQVSTSSNSILLVSITPVLLLILLILGWRLRQLQKH